MSHSDITERLDIGHWGALVPDRFVTADALTATMQVSAVRISMLMRSAGDNTVNVKSSYQFNGQSYDAADRRVYTPFSTTINVRNQVN